MAELIEKVDDVGCQHKSELNDISPELQNDCKTPSEPKLFAHKDLIQMQRLAKKHRAFLVQKVTKRIKLLKNKKGSEAQLSKNQRKVERLLQRINDMKVLNFESIVADMVEKEFKIPANNFEDTKYWFMYELTQDKSSFISFVHSFVNDGDPVVRSNPSKRKRNTPPSDEILKKEQFNGNELFTDKLSSYSERDDEVLNDILRVKKNRPGQRARQKQWEEMYGTKAKHIVKEKGGKQKSRSDGGRHKKSKLDETAPQEIMRKLKEKEKLKKEKQKEEHPSWLAKKQQASLSSRIDAFAGKKTTFSDDDD